MFSSKALPLGQRAYTIFGAIDRSIARFTPQDVVRFFHQVTMRQLRFTAASFRVSLS